MNIKLNYIMLACILLGYQSYSNAQEIGKIFSKSEANQKYGPVIQSFPADDTTLTSLISKAGNYVMFGVSNGNLTILGHDRNLLYPKNKSVSSSEKFRVFSVSKVEDLIKRGTQNVTIIEYRGNIISLTKGNYTLAAGTVCPPNCP